jgi:hypothetical protein
MTAHAIQTIFLRLEGHFNLEQAITSSMDLERIVVRFNREHAVLSTRTFDNRENN